MVPEGPRCTAPEARASLEARDFRFPRRNILFHCLKGGAAKTTLAYNTAYRLAQYGARVLLVDMDKQANATLSLLPKFRPGDAPVFVDVVTGKAKIKDAIVTAEEGIDVIPSSLDNARLELELSNRPKNPHTYYKTLFQPVRDHYDFVVFDMPPDLGHSTYLASLYADAICIPTSADEFGVYGTRLTLAAIEGLLAEYSDAQPEVLVVWSRFDGREKSSLQFLSEFEAPEFASVFPYAMRTDVTFKVAQSRRKSVYQLRKKSAAREDIDKLARALGGIDRFFLPKGNA